METFAIEEVTRAIPDALHLGTVGFDAVKHLLPCRIERRPTRLDMETNGDTYSRYLSTLIRSLVIQAANGASNAKMKFPDRAH